ncbi:MAG: VPLPA-CTERM sorting domain-containing protein [Gammaproteobacteria bacterium]|nr:VPLPA-CTERM sorting domain-containing protein [Gammaproteobacteria bacterium]
MNRLRRTIKPLALGCAVFGVGLANAATISTTGNFSGNSQETWYSATSGTSSYLDVVRSNISDLQQFDPALGTLTGVTLSTNFTVTVEGEVGVYESIDPSMPHSAEFYPWDGYTAGITTVVAFFTSPTTTATLASATTDIRPSCAGEASAEPCFGSTGYSFLFADESWIIGNTLEKIGLGNLLGTGVLGGLTVSSYHPSDSAVFALNNVSEDEVYGLISTEIFAGSVTLTYEYTPTPVPVPAAVWLFASGIAGLLGFAKRKAA